MNALLGLLPLFDDLLWFCTLLLAVWGLLLVGRVLVLRSASAQTTLIEAKERRFEAKIIALLQGAMAVEEKGAAMEGVVHTLCELYPAGNRQEFAYLTAALYQRLRVDSDWAEKEEGQSARRPAPAVRLRLRRD